MALNEQERLLLKLKIAENTERYTDMLEVVKRLAREYPEYFIKEGQLKFLSIAYKNCVGHRRCSWRIINSLPEVTNERKKDITRRYLANIEDELTKFCTEIVEIIDKHLLQVATTMEVKVSLLKTKGDYCRYMAEIQTADKKAASVKNAEEFYKGAMSEVEKEMPPTHPEKLGLALNMSVFYYEIAENRHHACKLAKSAFDAAIADLDNMDETNYKSSTQILQLIRDNLTLWTSEDPDDSTD
ncbi:14-3-3 protein beta/alpha-like [Haliotis rufescens]|nr:14-3-3 protein beta/alpha-like [Haliotis rufescens]